MAMSKATLAAMMFFPGEALVTIDGTTGVFQGADRISNSGNAFNVRLKVTQITADFDLSQRKAVDEIVTKVVYTSD